MSTAGVRALLRQLVDDAGLFPPGNLPMATALATHRANQAGPRSALLGRFLCPASRLGELRAHLHDRAGQPDRLRLGLIMNTGTGGLPAAIADSIEDRRVGLEAVEIPLPPDADQSEAAHTTLHALSRVPSGVAVHVELPRVHGWRDALSLIAARGRGAKLRTGGLAPEAFPTEREVADFIRACVAEGAAFTCAADLRGAARHRDARTGREQHGFLNILVATCLAVRGAAVRELVATLADGDPAALAVRVKTVDAETAAVARRHFVSYGSCSFSEPVDDLAALGLLGEAAEGPRAQRPATVPTQRQERQQA
ncbi:MAG: hypothetical protein ACRDPK_13545 [Carbonactinosporaceae bacterium]